MIPRRAAACALALAGLLAALEPATAEEPGELMVFAAASTTDLVGELAGAFERKAGAVVRASFASSSTLARQIERGAPADVFVSANVPWMDAIDQAGAVEPGTRFDWMSNRVALVAPEAAPLAIEIAPGFDLAGAVGDERISIGDPSHVPAGRYARAALRTLGVWDAVSAKMVHAPDVRAALALVERGEVGAGLVYATDAAASARVRLVGLLPEESHPPIVYPVAILRGHDGALARRFVALLRSEQARRALERHGFLPLGPAAGARAGGPGEEGSR
jgi:molybdate transport system substrate-binding protein